MIIFIIAILSLVFSLIFGYVCNEIGKPKNINGFWWGFFLGIIGVIIVFCLPSRANDVAEKNDDKNEELNLCEETDDIIEMENYDFSYRKKFLAIYFTLLIIIILFVVLFVIQIKQG